MAVAARLASSPPPSSPERSGLSYADDKAIFLRHYASRAPHASGTEREEAWRVYYLGQRASLFGETLTVAEASYLKKEGKPAFVPNPKKRELPGGHPHEVVLEVSIYTRPVGQVFVGALLENRAGKRHVELTMKSGDRLYRVYGASSLAGDVLREAGLKATDLGFTELDALVRRYSDDPQGFSALAEKDDKTDWLEVMPRAAVLARWGPKGERAARHL